MHAVKDVSDGLAAGQNPIIAKHELTRTIVERYHGPTQAAAEADWFMERFGMKKVPDDIPVLTFPEAQVSTLALLQSAVPHESKSQLRRLVEQGAVSLSDVRLTSLDALVKIEADAVLRIGKRNLYRLALDKRTA